MKNYGLISEVDISVIEDTLRLVMGNVPVNEPIRTCEVGLYAGATSKGICDFIESHGRKVEHIGIDNGKDGEKLVHFPQSAKLILGNSNEVYYKVPDNSQDFIFIDGDHSYLGVIQDFYAFSKKVKRGGYLLFHDTGKHIKPFKDFQHGDIDNPDAYISVRKALADIGLLNVKNEAIYFDRISMPKRIGTKQWLLVYDEADENDYAGGICCFKKM